MNQPSRVLIANRGEIALRVARTTREVGDTAIAVYADQDLDAPFVEASDEAYALGGSSAVDTYLNADKLLELAVAVEADAIHPGYGFLAENPSFAARVAEAGITWIGPKAQVIELLGDKIRARRTALASGVSPVPGTQDPLTGREEVEEFIGKWGYPVVLKAADGGGGRGIHVMREDADLELFFTGRDLTQGAGFFVERYVPKARHLETQCGRDSLGNFAVYSTRDCSVQRRHQKLIEEAPAPFVPESVEQQLRDWSKALFDAVDYVGLGTCEFLFSDEGELYFLEVNPRLQVEHTVTEEVSGVDLVAAQLLIAAGEALPEAPASRGHSIELRVTSEDPANGLHPSMGTLSKVTWPTGPGVRVDSGIEAGDTVSPEFDSMIAKLIITAPSREQAIQRALRVIGETELVGLPTPLPLYEYILSQPEFLGADGELGVWTRWLEDGALDTFTEEYLASLEAEADLVPAPGAAEVSANAQTGRRSFTIELDGRRLSLTLPKELCNPGAASAPTPPRPPQPLRSSREQTRKATEAPSSDAITAPTQAIVVRVDVSPGDPVGEGDVLLVLESMKMESYVRSPRAGVVESVSVEVGANVGSGQVLATLSEEGDAE